MKVSIKMLNVHFNIFQCMKAEKEPKYAIKEIDEIDVV